MEIPTTAPMTDPMSILTPNAAISTSMSPESGISIIRGGKKPTTAPTAAAGANPRLRFLGRVGVCGK